LIHNLCHGTRLKKFRLTAARALTFSKLVKMPLGTWLAFRN
jgi:hypothetical protein